MEYINFEAEVEAENVEDEEELVFSDQENENFIDDSNCNNIQSPSFYRFVNQSRDPVEAVEDDDGSRLGRHDLKPDMFHAIKREQVEFDDFDDIQECANRFKKSLCSFEESNLQDSFFEAILYGLLFKLSPDIRSVRIMQKMFFVKSFTA